MDHIDRRLLFVGFIVGLLLGLLIILMRDYHLGATQIELIPPPIIIPFDFLAA